MKSKVIALLCLFSCILSIKEVNGQYREKIDSLKIVLNTTTSDSSKIKLYKEIAWNYGGIRSELATARLYTDSLAQLSKKTGNEEGAMEALICYGMVERYEGNYDKALEHLNKYVAYYREKGNAAMEAEGWYQIASIQNWLGNYDESLSVFQFILGVHEENENWNGVAATLNGIGTIFRRTEQPNKAIKTYQRAIALNEKYQLGRDLTYVLINIGNCYSDLEEYEQALEYYVSSLKISREKENSYGIAANLDRIGTNFGYRNLPHEALNYHLKALEIREELPNKRALLLSLIKVGKTYTELKNYEKAETYLKKGTFLAKNLDSKPQLMLAYNELTNLYVKKKDYRNAYKYDQKHNTIKDSIYNEEKDKQIAELQTKYETAEKDKEITVLTKENELQEATAEKEATLRNSLIGGLVALGIIGLLVFYNMRQRLKNQKLLTSKNEEISKAKLSEELQGLEMKALRAQMNPHFLFNSLNSINTMILNDEPDNASKYLSKFSKLVRLMLENSEQPEISLKDELETLEAYIQLESIRFNNKMDYKIDVDSDIDQDDTYLPSMVLQPFVENAIWHGLLHKNKKGLLTIDVKEDGDNLLCSVIDNGVGREKSLTLKKDGGLKKKSMGIKITKDRLKLLTQQKIQDVINIIDLKDNDNNALGTQVNIQIPLS